ncbi:MAG: YitT family protein, partial [Bacteroidaceae bacterium]|nr:YitT family protein [Bacteroidaceae bacterium]
MTKSNIFHELKDYALISAGVILYAIGVTVFMLPYSLTTGGVAGIASIIYYVTGVEVQVTYVVINIILLIIAIKELGIRFCMKTIYAVFLMTFVLWLFQRIIEVPDAAHEGTMMLPKLIGDESFMACVLGAILCGSGVALCFENNGSTGGTDIIAAIVNKHKNMSLGSVIMACDVVIISSCYFIFHDWFRVIYGFVMLFICSTTIDYWMHRRHQSVQFMIFSRNPDAIADAIVDTHHGVTILDGEGWYTHTDRKVIVSVIRRRDQMLMQRIIKRIDPYAFISMTDASGVWGEGFDKFKVRDKRPKEEKNKKNAVLVCVTNNTTKIDT